MSNFFQTASEWISEFREQHCTDDGNIRCDTTCPWIPIKVTRAANTTDTNAEGVKSQTQHVNFIVKKATLDKYNIKIERALEILFKNEIYEVTLNKGVLWDWNDPAHVDVILYTVYKEELQKL